MKRLVSPEFLEKRNAEIVEMINKGVVVTKLGTIYHMSRERICQIYFARTGKSVRQLRGEKILELSKQIAAEAIKNRPKCKQCGRPTPNGRSKFCSEVHHNIFFSKRREKIARRCDWCHVEFFPFSTSKYKKSTHSFCKRKHYFLWNKEQKKPIQERNMLIIKMIRNGIDSKTIQKRFLISSPYFYTIIRQEGVSMKEERAKRLKKFLKDLKK